MSAVPRPAAFLDKDGVLVPDLDGRGTPAPYPGTGAAVARLNEAGLVVVVVTNQPVVGRGEVTEAQVEEALAELTRTVAEDGGRIDASFYCPHHPRADLPEYRRSCECRKPAPGMLLEAAEALGLDLAASAMVGDRPSDMEAGWRAGCRTLVLVESGKHLDPRILSELEPLDVTPTARVAGLAEAVDVILGQRR